MKCQYLFPVALRAQTWRCSAHPRRADEGKTDPKAKPITVTVKSLSFDPKKLEVHVGDIGGVDQSGPHEAHGDIGRRG